MTPPRSTLTTPRLTLRPSDGGDARRAFEIRGNPAVARMLSLALYPPSRDELDVWFADHPREWREGLAFRFAILLDGRMIGLADLDDVADGEAELGYWLDEACWARGYGAEAARAIVGFAFGPLDLRSIRAGHADDNAASGRILERLGFRHLGDVATPSRSRGEEVIQRRYRLDRP